MHSSVKMVQYNRELMIPVNIGSQGHSQISEITYINLLYNHLTNVNQTEQILSSFSPEHQDNAK